MKTPHKPYDTRLIELAPAMLAALEQVVWKLNRKEQKEGSQTQGEWPWAKIDINDAVIREARVVIAKVRGE
jgi:hypothetical protein